MTRSEYDALIERNHQLRAALVAEMERTAQAFGLVMPATTTPAQPPALTDTNQKKAKEAHS